MLKININLHPVKTIKKALTNSTGVKSNSKPVNDLYIPNFNRYIKREDFINTLTESTSSDSDFSAFENTIKENSALLSSFSKEGLPLSYPRKKFVNNLETILRSIDREGKTAILTKLGIELTRAPYSNKIAGYNGILDPEKLNLNDKTQKRIYDECYKFLYQNSVNTGNEYLDEALNTVIKGAPEFINIIGKKQHGNHDYSVDIHSLMVLCNIINHPEYKNLSDDDKFILKMTALFHDIGKKEGVTDPEHPIVSHRLALSFIDKYKLSPDIRTKVLKNIKNHQWLQWYNNSNASKDIVDRLISDYDKPSDYTMALIMSSADLAATSDFINNAFSYLLNNKQQRPMRKAVEAKFDVKL